MDFFILSLLLGINIIMQLYFRHEDGKKEPISRTEFWIQLYDMKKDLEEIMSVQNQETRKQMFNNYLSQRDLINSKFKENETKNNKDI